MAEFYRKKKKICQMCAGKDVDYKDVNIISKYIDEVCNEIYELTPEGLIFRNE